MDLLAVILVVAALICFGLAALGITSRVELVAAGLALFMGAVLAAGGLHASIGA
jgi:hypothetical protein